MAERTDSGRLFQRDGVHELKALAPVLVLILGMDRVIPLSLAQMVIYLSSLLTTR